MFNNVLLFVAAVLVALVLVLRGLNVAVAILIAFLAYSIPTLRGDFFQVLLRGVDETLLNTVLALVSAMFLANLYRFHAVSERLVYALKNAGSRMAGVAIPAIIGLLPMPAGAYVSAVMVNEVYNELGLRNEQKTFINYWFRHVWIPTWPLYQGVILTAGVLGLGIVEVVSRTWPIMVASILSGVIVSAGMLRREMGRVGGGGFAGLIHMWPLIALSVLSVVLHVPLFIAILLTAIALTLVYRVPGSTVVKSAMKALDAQLIGLITVSFLFGEVVEYTELTVALVNAVGCSNALVLVFTLPFVLVLATGFEFTFVVLAFPVLKPLLGGIGLTIAYLSGFLGAMLSPAHACLVISSKYFNSKLPAVYKHLLPATALTAVFTLLLSVPLRATA